MIGGVVSRTVIVCVALVELVQRSLAVQVRMMIVGQVPLVVETRVGMRFPSQLSVAATLAGGGTSLKHWKVWLVGTPESTGAIVSRTVIVWVALVELVQRSLAVQVRTIIVGQVPLVVEARVGVRFPSQLSVAATLAGGGTSEIHWKVWLVGTPESTGAIVSRTVIVCEALVELVQ